MSEAGRLFEQSITDAEEMLVRFDVEKDKQQGPNAESLKRAGMVLALASWETYVKDRFKEEINVWLLSVKGSQLGNFVQKRVDEDLKRFFNPNTDKTKQLFKTYFDVDVTESWKWDNYHPPQAKKVLNEFISKRGDAAHQANTLNRQSHLIKRDELEKAIRFLKGLVRAMEKVTIAK
ncbi:HEPN domain-containing protein [Vibrio hannami]|uniref:HEPN domain-containing protein n=1 Tax=Vibrio hannami TaxID=2717094 RepID=UPI002410521F|nr:HEPN domain-containing protein [Vibrio hannami]MDG3087814.1 HEPN domain-containing protein [Vibrio hannami]